METAELFKHFDEAEARVAADAEHVSRLERLITAFELQDMADWANQARKLLVQFEAMRAQHIAERDWLKERIAKVRA